MSERKNFEDIDQIRFLKEDHEPEFTISCPLWKQQQQKRCIGQN